MRAHIRAACRSIRATRTLRSEPLPNACSLSAAHHANDAVAPRRGGGLRFPGWEHEGRTPLEARRGRLLTERIAGKEYTTLAQIEECGQRAKRKIA